MSPNGRGPRLLAERAPVKETPWIVVLDRAVTGVTACALLLTVMLDLTRPHCGARHSTQVQRESRQASIETAVEAQRPAE